MSIKTWQDVLLEVAETDPADFTDRKNICISPKDLGDILRAALQERDAEIERLTSEAMFQQQMVEPDDILFERIEHAARTSFRRHQSSVRGQQVTRADSYESHLVWAARAERDTEIERLTAMPFASEAVRAFVYGKKIDAQRKVLAQALEALQELNQSDGKDRTAGQLSEAVLQAEAAITAIQEQLK